MNLPSRQEWEEAGFKVPDEICSELCSSPKLTYADLLAQRDELLKALRGMLENYLNLKSISLKIAKSDAPGWIGQGLGVEDDIHVIAVRKAIARAEGKP